MRNAIDDIREIFPLLIVFALVIIIPISLFVGLQSIYSINYCSNLSELNPERRLEWRFWGGCMIETKEGVWLPVDDIVFLDKPIREQ